VLDTLLYPRVKLDEGEVDITTFRVEASGQQAGRPCRWQAEMIDRYDQALGFTSMARTTAFTGAIVARMAARGELAGARGLIHPEQVISGPRFERLLDELASVGVSFQINSH
jgi:saccharopine dehydrogenase-like NADP-dependent oxidoreductase